MGTRTTGETMNFGECTWKGEVTKLTITPGLFCLAHAPNHEAIAHLDRKLVSANVLDPGNEAGMLIHQYECPHCGRTWEERGNYILMMGAEGQAFQVRFEEQP